MKLSIQIIIGVMSVLSLASFADEKTDKNWSQQLKEQGLEAKDQAYCYTNEEGKAEGANLDLRIRLASVSKLVTSLWAVEKLGVDHKYETKLFIKGNNLHIQGSYDPFLGNEKMFFLVSQLNELGFTKFDTITFDKNLLINPDVQYEADEYPTMNSVTNGRYLKMYFNTNSWSTDTKDEYSNYYSLAKAGRFVEK
ncbi:MAG: D-alanyl-D-alanine carboxypeptidase, partial [Bacteriovorax sp.]